MKKTPQQGLQPLANGSYAWLATRGTWGWSNAGLITDGEESLLVDTLFDLELTGQMLATMGDAEPRARTMGPVGEYFLHCCGQLQFQGIRHTPPTETFEERMELQVGDQATTDIFELFSRMAELAGFGGGQPQPVPPSP